MADVTKTYLTEDWKIWTYKPVDDRFVLDLDKLNDADHPLSATEGTIAKIDALIAGITINEGGQIEQGIFSSLEPASMTVEMSIKNFVTDDARKFFIGSEIWATHANGATVSNTYNGLGKNSIYFMGRIRSFNVDIQPGADFSTVSIFATSRTEDDVNTLITITKDTTSQKKNLITDAAYNQAGISLTATALDYNFANTATETKSFGEWVTDLNICDLDVIYDQPYADPSQAANNTVWRQRVIAKENFWAGIYWGFSNDDIIDAQLDYSGASAPTGVTLTNYANNALVYQYGTGATSGTGSFNYSNTIDVKDITQMQTIGQKMISMTQSFRPISITTKTATNYQDITYREFDQLSNSRWFYPVNLVNVGSVNIISFNNLSENVTCIVTGRTLEITPDDWTTTYQLWKGFDY
jgi:hypothetical protein